MTPQEESKANLLASLALIRRTDAGLAAHTGDGREFISQQRQILVEGLFINAWSCWEQFLQNLLVYDLAAEADGTVGRIAKSRSSRDARKDLAEHILFHPDHPNLHVNWDFDHVEARARKHLPEANRFGNRILRLAEMQSMKRIRNAIAHRSEAARHSFRTLVQEFPFSIDERRSRELSVGEFLTEHCWPIETESGTRKDGVFAESILVIEDNAKALVP